MRGVGVDRMEGVSMICVKENCSYWMELEKENENLKKELYQQKFNNKHNMSIDQTISDEIFRLREESKNLRGAMCKLRHNNTWQSEEEVNEFLESFI